MPLPLLAFAIPMALKLASAYANKRSQDKYTKKATRASANDALVAALSKGTIQSDSVPDYHPSKFGAGLGFAGDLAGLYFAAGGKLPGGGGATAAANASLGGPEEAMSAGDSSEMASAYGQSRTRGIGDITGPIARSMKAYKPQESYMPSSYGPEAPPKHWSGGSEYIDPSWKSQGPNYGPEVPEGYVDKWTPRTVGGWTDGSLGASKRKQSLIRRALGGR